MRDRVCQIVDGIYVEERERDACLIANLIRVMNRKISHEVGTLALGEGANDTLVITPDEDVHILYAHCPGSQHSKLDGDPFKPTNVPRWTLPSIA